MRSLIIGYGSIGNRHARILTELGCSVAVLSKRSIDFSPSYPQLQKAIDDFMPQYIVIANPTSEHYSTLFKLKGIGFRGTLLVEKPIFAKKESLDISQFKNIFIGYNLRFHPLLLRLKELVHSKNIYSVQVYVGKNLAEWRPGIDYRASYSSLRDQGGGVLRDLSHEIDYLLWIFGKWKNLTAIGDHYSKLEIDTDDSFSLMFQTEYCPAIQLQMNYLDQVGRRHILVNYEKGTILVDLYNGWIDINGNKEEQSVERDWTYREEHKAILAKDAKILCTYSEALEVMDLIESAEKSSHHYSWVKQ